MSMPTRAGVGEQGERRLRPFPRSSRSQLRQATLPNVKLSRQIQRRTHVRPTSAPSRPTDVRPTKTEAPRHRKRRDRRGPPTAESGTRDRRRRPNPSRSTRRHPEHAQKPPGTTEGGAKAAREKRGARCPPMSGRRRRQGPSRARPRPTTRHRRRARRRPAEPPSPWTPSPNDASKDRNKRGWIESSQQMDAGVADQEWGGTGRGGERAPRAPRRGRPGEARRSRAPGRSRPSRDSARVGKKGRRASVGGALSRRTATYELGARRFPSRDREVAPAPYGALSTGQLRPPLSFPRILRSARSAAGRRRRRPLHPPPSTRARAALLPPPPRRSTRRVALRSSSRIAADVYRLRLKSLLARLPPPEVARAQRLCRAGAPLASFLTSEPLPSRLRRLVFFVAFSSMGDLFAPPFTVTADELARCPSRLDGVSAVEEARLLRFGCAIVQECGALLHQEASAVTAQLLLHRFFCRRSLRDVEMEVAATACLWLACKAEEAVEIQDPDRLRLRDVILVAHRVCCRRRRAASPSSSAISSSSSSSPPPLLDPRSRAYECIKESVLRAERHVLVSLGFWPHCEAPHRSTLTFGTIALGLPSELLQAAWSLTNDACRTRLCVLFGPQALAAGAIFAAARGSGVALPESPPWWRALGARDEEVVAVAGEILRLGETCAADDPYVPYARGAPGWYGLPPEPRPACRVAIFVGEDPERADGALVPWEGRRPRDDPGELEQPPAGSSAAPPSSSQAELSKALRVATERARALARERRDEPPRVRSGEDRMRVSNLPDKTHGQLEVRTVNVDLGGGEGWIETSRWQCSFSLLFFHNPDLYGTLLACVSDTSKGRGNEEQRFPFLSAGLIRRSRCRFRIRTLSLMGSVERAFAIPLWILCPERVTVSNPGSDALRFTLSSLSLSLSLSFVGIFSPSISSPLLPLQSSRARSRSDSGSRWRSDSRHRRR